MSKRAIEQKIVKIEEILSEKRGKQVWVLRPGDQEPEPHELAPKDVVIELNFEHRIS